MTAVNDGIQAEEFSRRDAWRIPILLSGNVLGVMLIAAANPGLAAIADHFRPSAPNADFLVRISLTLPGIVIALFSPLAGLLADRWGRRPLFLWSIVLYGAAGALGALAPTIEVFLGARLLQGVAAAGVINACAILVADYFSGSARERVVGWQSAAISGGAVVFLLLAGVLAASHWSAPFWLYVGAAAVAFVAVFFGIQEPPIQRLSAAQKPPRASAIVWGVAFLAGVTANFMFMPTIHGPFLLTERGYADPRQIGIALAALSFAGACGAFAYGLIRRALGATGVFALVFVCGGAGALIVAHTQTYPLLMIGLAVFGVGVGVMMPNLMSVAFAASDDLTRAKAVAFVNTGIFVGESTSPFVTEPIRASLGVLGLFNMSGAALTVLAIVFAIAALTRRSKPAVQIG
jgi:MFS family permease